MCQKRRPVARLARARPRFLSSPTPSSYGRINCALTPRRLLDRGSNRCQASRVSVPARNQRFPEVLASRKKSFKWRSLGPGHWQMAKRVAKRHLARPSSNTAGKKRKYPQAVARAPLSIAMRLLRGSDQTGVSNITAAQTSYEGQAYEQLNQTSANGPVPAQGSHLHAATPPGDYLGNLSLFAHQPGPISHRQADHPMQQMFNTFGMMGGTYSGSLQDPFHEYQNIPCETDGNQIPRKRRWLVQPSFQSDSRRLRGNRDSEYYNPCFIIDLDTHAVTPVALQAMQGIGSHGIDRKNQWSSHLRKLRLPREQ
ncbi:hypothetical protein BKA70DRAFT_1246588 [Coprinopsis sp. MPI-PUGE-AT-0042]|nr:hypothetical protein BKA70DRAFT_1246588 [Coprinopsis sp. MPI-PUGE-AT-0042]